MRDLRNDTLPVTLPLASDTGRSLADQAFSRASGAQLIGGNRIVLLRDAAENYPAWLDAIESAEHSISFESYILRDDRSGHRFADALSERARAGVAVRVLYDWLGAVGKTPGRFWSMLRGAGVEVRCFNPFRFVQPLGWVHRDHRKSLVVDEHVGFITGLCVGDDWVGYPERGIAPWRDTGVELRGPAVAEIERAFRRVWQLAGPPFPPGMADPVPPDVACHFAVRVVATEPTRGGMLRVGELVAAAARRTLWLTDAYFAGVPSYVQALRAAALDGVDVRLLVPGGTDIPILRPISQAGYRPLLEAGVRVFEWNGPMLHAKTAVADGNWARVGSSNLNLASWVGNYELDVIVEDAAFARTMEEQYVSDLDNATEVLLTARRRVIHAPRTRRGGGSAGRAAAGAVRLGNTVTAAVGNRRVLAPTEARIVAFIALGFAALAYVVFQWPRLLAWPFAVLSAWLAVVLMIRAFRLRAQRRRAARASKTTAVRS